MRRLTVLDARTVCARALGMCPTDSLGATNSSVLEYMNEAQDRLLNRPGKPVGSFARYLFRINESSIVLPRQIRTVERASICERPVAPVPEWFEFSFNGPGQQDSEGNIGDTMIDHGTDCKYDDITAEAVDRTIQVTTDLTEDASTYLWLFGYDENNNWIRTTLDGGVTYVDGERFDLSTAPGFTTHFFTQLTRVKKDLTKGPVRLYEYDDTLSVVVRSLAVYEPSETDPIYRRMYIPGLADMGACCDDDSDDPKAITVFARLQHIPLTTNERDAFVIGNLPALKLMCLAIKAEEEQRLKDAVVYQQMAEREIDGELAAYLGDGQRIGLNFEDRELYGGGGVENVI